MEDSSTSKLHIIYGVSIVLIVSIFCYAALAGDKNGSLKIQIGDSELDISLEGDSLSVRNMLDVLFRDDETRRESSALLK